MRFGPTPIQSTYLIDQADLIACHNSSYVERYDLLEGIKEGGVFLLNSPWTAEEMDTKLPASIRRTIAQKKIRFYNIDAVKIAGEVGLGGRINMVMQAAFFQIANVIPPEDAIGYIKEAIKETYGRKGDKIVQMNWQAVDKAIEALQEIKYPASWAEAEDEPKAEDDVPEYIKNVVEPILLQKGDELPVSAVSPNGVVPTGTSKYEKRGIAIDIPEWQPENCIQCNQCSLVCPHAAIRPILAKPEDLENAPESFTHIKAIGKEAAGLQYRIQVAPLDCVGCGNCADICPGKRGEKALIMKPLEEQRDVEVENERFAATLPEIEVDFKPDTVKGSQFRQPLLEFSGACAGCGETAYVKLATQMFGDRMIIANATGCSSIWGGSAPTCPYTTNSKGHGPAWANSLFEDNAEFGFGIALGVEERRSQLADILSALKDEPISDALKEAISSWLENKEDAEGSRKHGDKIKALLPREPVSGRAKELVDKAIKSADQLTKKSVWIIGGDGWAYDIGFGGLDHVLASGADVNILVLDTEVYSNTGGQSSKATPTAAVAKFAAAGKRTRKKDLGLMAMSYGYVYVASVSLGANPNHVVKVMKEAEAYNGPSLIIAYAPCINHGINMSRSLQEGKKAVEAGYWPLYRYNPELALDGKNPFILDSKEPTGDFREFLMGQVRYTSLKKQLPDEAEVLYKQAEEDARLRLETYKRLAEVQTQRRKGPHPWAFLSPARPFHARKAFPAIKDNHAAIAK